MKPEIEIYKIGNGWVVEIIDKQEPLHFKKFKEVLAYLEKEVGD